MCWADTDLGRGVVHHHVGRTGAHREGLVVVRRRRRRRRKPGQVNLAID